MRTPLLAVILAASVLPTQAQSPAFEVASIKANKSGPMAPQRVNTLPGERVTITNVTTRTLIQVAHNLSAQQILGGPRWLDDDRFDVVAKAERPASRAELLAMLQTLLEERFKFKAHSESRSTPVYALMLARKDSTLGAGLRRANTTCAALREKADGNPDPCGVGTMAKAGVTGKVAVRGMELTALIGAISRDVGRPVVDRTGLTGIFDFELTWTPQAFLQREFDRSRFDGISPEGPSMFTALEEQLGLKLESDRDAGTVLVIDSVERPTEN